jgi:dihydroneopterin aldolase
MASTISIVLRDIELVVQVGEHPWEQHPERPTRLHLSITLTFAYAGYFDKHGGYVDYDPLRKVLKDLEQRPHTNRLEDIARVILDACFATTPAERVRLSVLKPDIFVEMKGIGLEFDVSREDFARAGKSPV